MGEMAGRTKLAIVMSGIIVLAALGLRVSWWLYPATQPSVPTNTISFEDQLINTTKEFESQQPQSSGLEITESTSVTVPAIKVVQPTASADNIIQYKSGVILGTGMFPVIIPFKDHLVLGYSTGQQYLLQKLNLDYTAQGDPTTLITDLPLVNDQPQSVRLSYTNGLYVVLIMKEDQWHVLRFTEDFTLKTDTIVSVNDQTVLLSNQDTLWLATPQDTTHTTLTQMNVDGSVSTEQTIENTGEPFRLYEDNNQIIIIGQQDQQIIFTKLAQTDTASTQLQQFSIPTRTAVNDFEKTAEYLFFVDTTSIQVYAEDLLQYYSSVNLQQPTADQTNITVYNDHVLATYVTKQSEYTEQGLLSFTTMYLDDYEII